MISVLNYFFYNIYYHVGNNEINKIRKIIFWKQKFINALIFQHVWDSSVEDDKVIFSLHSDDRDQGYPGHVIAQVSS